ncbi:hypothetical protein MANES_04G113532v8 [Manihot esculenta]|uniref:Uncharacterized protein n=1 Tax=Manihot esculenta TaxID=3983 RepID=A0ACB7HVU6_MANES|nr:hypothetical protein MANES_04G113532v8 [Manihot esculenta]
MAVSRSYADGLRIAVTVAFVFCLMFLPPEPDLNSEMPPCCVNKCFSCRPCMATLVVPSDQKKSLTFKALSHGDNDDNGNKLFQP